uniref:Growth hormone n=2 Tax=Malurus TaxID=55806 RepID=A0A8C5TCR4_9PASS
MAPGSWLSPLALAVVTVALQWPQPAATFPAVPLSSLFANAVLRAQHLHLLAAETYKEFERSYIPEEQRHTNKNSQVAYCYSETIPAPTGKEDAQQKSDMELLRFSLVLIQSWLGPVQYLSKVFTNNLFFGTSDRVYEKLKDLEEGIQALMRVRHSSRNPAGITTFPIQNLSKPSIKAFPVAGIHWTNSSTMFVPSPGEVPRNRADFARFSTSQCFINIFFVQGGTALMFLSYINTTLGELRAGG